MGHLLGYRIKVENYEQQIIVCELFDNLSYVDGPATTVFTDLEGSESPFKLSVIDNDEDKFTPIRAHQLEINFLSTPTVDTSDFVEGPDNRWFVKLWFESTGIEIFEGFISLSDVQEDFLSEPNTVTLTAYDGLGALKDLPLVDFSGINPKGTHSIVGYLSWALARTGLFLPFNIANSLWERNMIIRDSIDLGWWYTYIDALTWEDEIGTCINCYEVIEKLLGEDCTLFQYRGEWFIIRIEEMDQRGLKFYRFTWNGDYISTTTRQVYDRDIASDGIAFFSEENTYTTFERPLKLVKEIFSYQYAKEIISNIDFSRGAQDTTLDPLAYDPIEGIDYPTGGSAAGIETKAYHLDDWTLYEGFPVGGPPHTSAFIKRVFEDTYEKSRYVVITPGAAPIVGGGPERAYWLASQRFPVNKKDKFTFSADVRYGADTPSGVIDSVVLIRLFGDDGSFWSVDNDGKWLQTSDWSALHTLGISISATDDAREWVTTSTISDPVPVNGYIEIDLLHETLSSIRERHFSNLSFDYKAFVNGTYQKYDSQYFKVGQLAANEANYKEIKENDVFIADTPQRLFKGCLFRKVTITVPPPGSGTADDISPSIVWRDNSNTGFTDYKPYNWWQAFSRWNQHNRTMRLFDVHVQGCYGDQFFGLLHLFNLQDSSDHTDNKIFMLLHYELDLFKCEWSGILAEVMDTTKAKTYSETTNAFEFKYLSR